MQARRAVRVALLGAIVAGLAVVVLLRPEEDGPPGWVDCTSDRIQATPQLVDGPELVDLGLEALGQVEEPVTALDVDGRLLVGSRTGMVTDLATGETVLDLTGSVATSSEQGLLGLAASPDDSWLYVSYVERTADSRAEGGDVLREPIDGVSRIRAWSLGGGRPLDPAAGVDILALPQPHRQHNGGGIRFGPDGHLYAGFGDGGGLDLPVQLRARDRSNLFGSIIRIDPTPDVGGYEVPPDNPYVNDDGAAAPEILHHGLRNPWRFDFDSTDRLWIADVGHYCWEEINVVAADGGPHDFGWPGLEATFEWAYEVDGSPTPPVHEYPHGDLESGGSCAVSGGQLYEGSEVPELRGMYVFADFCDGRLRALRVEDEQVVVHDLGLSTAQPVAIERDGDGELLVLSFEDGGLVSRIVPG